MNVFATWKRRILDILERRRVRRAFGNYVNPKVLAAIERNPELKELKLKPLKPMHLQFIFVSIDEKNIEETSLTLGSVLEVLYRCHATRVHISASLVVACLGGIFPEYDSVDGRHNLVAELLNANGDRVRIIHGQCVGRSGIFGTPNHRTYALFIPGFSGLLKKLLDSPFGIATEIPSMDLEKPREES